MKILTLTLTIFIFLAFGCGKSPVAVEIKDVCSQPEGANVVIQGYISLPQLINTIQKTRGGRIEAVGLQLYVMNKADATGDSVKTTFWTSDKGEPNRIKPLPKSFTWNDLLVYTDDGKQIGAGRIVKVTGEVKPDAKSKCEINITKIENP